MVDFSPESLFLHNFFDALNAADINYAILRNYETLPDSLNGSDLDILVLAEDINMFEKILEKISVNINCSLVSKIPGISPKYCYLGNNCDSWFGLQMDLFPGIVPFRGISLFDSEFMFENVENFNEIKILNRDSALIVSFFKEIVNNNRCDNEKYFMPIAKVFEHREAYWLEKLTDIFDASIAQKTVVCLKKWDEKNIAALARQVRKKVLKQKNFWINIKNLMNKVKRVFKPSGFSIAFLGTDGSGKTTIIEALTPTLSSAMHNALYYEHMRPNLIPNIAQALGKPKCEGPTTDPHAGKQSGFCISLFRLFYYLFDYIFGFWLKIYPVIMRRSCIFIFDRYYYDYLIDQKRSCLKLPLWIIQGLEIFIPKPDLLICLGGNPQKIHERKKEIALEEVERQTFELKHLCERLPNAVWIDTDCKLEISVDATMRAIIRKMAVRYE